MFGLWAAGTAAVVIAAVLLTNEESWSEVVVIVSCLLPPPLGHRPNLGGVVRTPSGVLSCALSHLLPSLERLVSVLFTPPLRI